MREGIAWFMAAAVMIVAGGVVARAQESVPLPGEEEARSAAVTEDRPGDAEALEEAPPMRVSMEFQGASLSDVLKIFSQRTGINVITSGDVGDEPITLYLEDVEALDALDQILEAGNLTYERSPGSDIYIVKPRGAEPTQRITRVYRIKYARVSESVLAKAAAILSAQTPFEASLSSSDESSGGSSSSSSGGSSSSSGGASSTGASVGIDVIIKQLLSDQGDVVVDGRTNSLIVTDVPENFPRIEAALAALDIQTPQILIDAEILETTLNKIKDLGIEWGGSAGNVFTLTPGSRSTRFPFGRLTHNDEGGTTFSLSTLSLASFQAAMQALEKDTETKILARPKILTLDNESALIRLTTNETIGFETTSTADTGSTTSTPERETTGVVMVVTPQVNERGYITMILEPSVTKTVAAQITPPSGQATTRDPKTRSSRTLVRIKSGDTLVVGGLIDRSDQTTMKRVPILSGIPVVGEAFKNEEINDTTSELVVFVTPTILDESRETRLVASAEPQGPPPAREQESATPRHEAIEETLNRLEPPSSL